MSASRVKLLLLLFVLAFAVPTFAGTIDIDYSNATAGGVLTVSSGKATGSSIPIGQLIVTDGTTVTTYVVTGGCSKEGCLNFNTASDTISITGAITKLGITSASTVLSSGTFDLPLPPGSITPRKSGGYDFSATGDATTNATLLADLGLPSPQGAQSYDIFTITASTKVKGASGFMVTSVDFGTTAQTPEPVSMMLMGTFLTLAGGLLSRKKKV